MINYNFWKESNFTGSIGLVEDKAQFTKSEAQKFWQGPYNILVSHKIDSVPAADGVNILYKGGRQTQMFINSPLSASEYIKLYALYNEKDGRWHYKGNRQSKPVTENIALLGYYAPKDQSTTDQPLNNLSMNSKYSEISPEYFAYNDPRYVEHQRRKEMATMRD